MAKSKFVFKLIGDNQTIEKFLDEVENFGVKRLPSDDFFHSSKKGILIHNNLNGYTEVGFNKDNYLSTNFKPDHTFDLNNQFDMAVDSFKELIKKV